MYFKSKKTSLLILAVSAIVCSRVLFLFFDDPEGPNLLVVMVMAGIVYFLSLSAYVFNTSLLSFTGLQRLLLAILIQILIVTGLYVLLN